MPIEQLENDLAAFTLLPTHAVTGGISLLEFLQRFLGNFEISADGKVRALLPSKFLTDVSTHFQH